MIREVVPALSGIDLGRQGEHMVTVVRLPNRGAGTVLLLHQRPTDRAPYPVHVQVDGDSVLWVVTGTDTAASGHGCAEIQWLGDDGSVLKSTVWRTNVLPALSSPGETPPPPVASYAEAVAKDAKTAKDAAAFAAGSAASAAQSAQAGQTLYDQVKDDLAAGKLKGQKGDKGDPGTPGLDAPQIDDAVISAESPWSSKRIVETLCPPLEASGNPVTCEPVAGYPLGVVASWEPTQAGSGEPSLDSIRPIVGREAVQVSIDSAVSTTQLGDTYSLLLPQTVYGGTVDVVTGAGASEWQTYVLRGNEFMTNQHGEYDNNTTVMINCNILIGTSLKADNLTIKCNRIPSATAGQSLQNVYLTGWLIGVHPNAKYADYLYIRMPRAAIGSQPTDTPDDVAAKAKAWFAAQYAAGTSVQIAYRLAKPVPFQATGNGPIMPLGGVTNTITTDADSVTVTGRADPIRIIQQLQAAQSTAAVQLAETQQAVVDTTAMAVDYIYEQDSQIFGGDTDDDQTDTVPT